MMQLQQKLLKCVDSCFLIVGFCVCLCVLNIQVFVEKSVRGEHELFIFTQSLVLLLLGGKFCHDEKYNCPKCTENGTHLHQVPTRILQHCQRTIPIQSRQELISSLYNKLPSYKTQKESGDESRS